MVADKDQQFYYEGNSQAVAPEVVDRVWHVASDLGYGRVFIPGVKHTLTDDHVALQKVGIHAIDVVDFDYPYWHTTERSEEHTSELQSRQYLVCRLLLEKKKKKKKTN